MLADTMQPLSVLAAVVLGLDSRSWELAFTLLLRSSVCLYVEGGGGVL